MAMVERAALIEAVRSGERIDACAGLGVRHPKQAQEDRRLGRRPYRPGLRQSGHIPPFLFAAYQRQRLLEVDGSRGVLDYRAFERLSLMVRTALFKSLTRTVVGSAQLDQKVEDKKADDLLAVLKLKEGKLGQVRAEAIAETLCWMTQTLAEPTATEALNPHLRRGLQIVGCRITRGPGGAPTDEPLDLSNLKLPFPVSFIGCVFEMPLMVNESEMISLDLSGSALPGLEARGLKTLGGVHLRRATVISPVSFAGARIGGLFDASDALITQMLKVPVRQVEDADHGVLNLSKTVIHNEVLLERTRVWGGLSMRGAEAHRSIFLTGALIASPLAVLEKWAYDVLNASPLEAISGRVGETLRRLRHAHKPFGGYAEHLARNELHDPDLPSHTARNADGDPSAHGAIDLENQINALVALECVLGSDWSDHSLEIMLTESLRARTNAIRADGLKVVGNLFAEHLRAHGRVRLKSAEITGSVRLSGAVLRSGDETRDMLDELAASLPKLGTRAALKEVKELIKDLDPIVHLRRWTGHSIGRPAKFVPQDYALDLREGVIGGDISFAPGEQTPLGDSQQRRPPDHLPTHIYGVISLGGVTMRGSVQAANVRFHWRPKHVQAVMPQGVKPLTADKLGDRQAVHDEDEAVGLARVDGAKSRPADQRKLVDQYAFILRQATIGKDLDLRGSDGLWGLQLEEARIAGRVRCSQPHSGKDLDYNRLIPLSKRARHLGGVFNLRGTKIGSDCFLIFHADYGPTIKAENCVVDGHLNIYPAVDAQRYVLHPCAVSGPAASTPDSFEWDACAHTWAVWRSDQPTRDEAIDTHPSPPQSWKGELAYHRPRWLSTWRARSPFRRAEPNGAPECYDCGAVLSIRKWNWRDRKEWFIDLRNARASVFCHPPSAWPHPGALSLDGFRYEQSSSLGPLPPVLSDNLLQHPPNAPGPADHPAWDAPPQSHRVRTGAIVATIAALAWSWLLAFGQGLGPLWQPLALLAAILIFTIAMPWQRAFLLRTYRPGDRRNLWRRAGGGVAAAVIFTSLCITLYRFQGQWIEPGFRAVLVGIIAFYLTSILLKSAMAQPALQYRPLGLEYLARQRSEPNRFQFLTSRYSPNEPYRTAAQALRETGRYLAANEIERERIINRHRLLSWRQHGVSKIALLTADILSGFGFRLDRLASVIVASICTVALLAHYAANEGLITFDAKSPEWSAKLVPAETPKTKAAPPEQSGVATPPVAAPSAAMPPAVAPPVAATQRLDLSFGDELGEKDTASLPRDCSQRAALARGAKNQERIFCPGWMYAVDLLFPLDLQQPQWKVTDLAVKRVPTWASWAAGAVRNAMAIIQLYGAMLVAFFVAAVALRAEAAFTRVEE